MIVSANLNDPILYILYAAVLIFVVALSLYYLFTSIKRAKVINMDMQKVKKVITTSVSFTILPAIGIGLGIVTLVGALGIAFPSIRLSIIGALQYEAQMADGVATAVAGSMDALLQKGVSEQDFVTMASVMTVTILTGPLVVLFAYKKFQPKFKQLTAPKNNSAGGINIGDLAFQIVFIGMVIGYFAMSINSIMVDIKSLTSYYNFIAIIVAAVLMYIFELLINKCNQKWLDSFSTPFAMLIAMIVVAIISYFVEKNEPTQTMAILNLIGCI